MGVATALFGLTDNASHTQGSTHMRRYQFVNPENTHSNFVRRPERGFTRLAHVKERPSREEQAEDNCSQSLPAARRAGRGGSGGAPRSPAPASVRMQLFSPPIFLLEAQHCFFF